MIIQHTTNDQTKKERESKPVARNKVTVITGNQPIVEKPKEIIKHTDIIFEKADKSVADSTTVYHDNPETPFVMHNKVAVKRVYAEVTKANLVKDNIESSNEEENDNIIIETLEDTVELVSDSIETIIDFVDETLDDIFGTDIEKIASSIIDDSFDFNKYEINITLPYLEINEHDILDFISDNGKYIIGTPQSKAILFLIDVLLKEAIKIEIDDRKLSDMIIELLDVSESAKEWVNLITGLWEELKNL